MAFEGRRFPKLLAVAAPFALACSPPGIAGDDDVGESSSESGSDDAIDGDSGSAEESTGGESGGSEDGSEDDGWGPGCAGGTGGGGAFLDLCPPEDPCEAVTCPGQGCVSGMCVAEPAFDPCEPGLVVSELAVLEIGAPIHQLHFAELDDSAGEELVIVYEGGVMVWNGVELEATPFVGDHVQAAMFRVDDDGVDDLSLWAGLGGEPIFAAGDGMSGFGPSAPVDTKANTPLYRHPAAVDLDGDGLDELAAVDGGSVTIWPNIGGSLGLPTEAASIGERVAAIELDGSPGEELVTMSVILTGRWLDAVDGEFVVTDVLPQGAAPMVGDSGHRLSVAVVGDYDGDENEDLLLGYRDNYRSGVRVWWGVAGAGFTEPVDQELEDAGRPQVIHDLDGLAPRELLLVSGDVVSFARPDPDLGLAMACRSTLELAGVRVAAGDVNGDGVPELATSLAEGVFVATVMAE